VEGYPNAGAEPAVDLIAGHAALERLAPAERRVLPLGYA
jgi:hypothetical protein